MRKDGFLIPHKDFPLWVVSSFTDNTIAPDSLRTPKRGKK